MNKSRLLGAVYACFVLASTNVGADLVSVDWKTTGDNLITRDTGTGLEWLDLTQTLEMSYDEVTSQLGSGGLFEGWSYATEAQIEDYFDSAGGTRPYNGWSTANNGVVAPLIDLWGETGPATRFRSIFLTAEVTGSDTVWWGMIDDSTVSDNSPTQDFLDAVNTGIPLDSSFSFSGSALIRASVVPIPASVWLFGSGLLGLVGMARRKA